MIIIYQTRNPLSSLVKSKNKRGLKNFIQPYASETILATKINPFLTVMEI